MEDDKAQKLLDASIALIESESIRAWAQTDQNKPIWLKIAAEAIKNKALSKQEPNAADFAAYMVAVAIDA